MTISHPNKEKRLAKIQRLLMAAIGVIGFISIFLYNGMLTARAAHQNKEKEVAILHIENADLKNSYYQLLDTKHLDAAATQLGYVKDPSPNYLRLGAGDLTAR